MNPFITQILLSLFYLAVFIVACSAVTTSIRHIIHEVYACKTTYAKLAMHEQNGDVQAVNERIAKALAEK